MSLISIEDAIESAIQSVKSTYPKECPRCKIFVQGEVDIERFFGWRRCNGKVIPQSYCRKCRSSKFNPNQQTLFEYDLLIIHTIRDAIGLKKNFNVEGVISEKNYIKNIEFNGKLLKLCSATFTDKTNSSIEILLLGKDAQKIKNLSKIRMINGSLIKSDGKLAITTGESGRLDVIYEHKRKPIMRKINHSDDSQILDDSWIVSQSDANTTYLKETSDHRKFEDSKF